MKAGAAQPLWAGARARASLVSALVARASLPAIHDSMRRVQAQHGGGVISGVWLDLAKRLPFVISTVDAACASVHACSGQSLQPPAFGQLALRCRRCFRNSSARWLAACAWGPTVSSRSVGKTLCNLTRALCLKLATSDEVKSNHDLRLAVA